MHLNLEAQSEAKITQTKWLCPEELENQYGFSLEWQAKARKSSSSYFIPHSKVGGQVRYDRLKIDEWLESFHVTQKTFHGSSLFG